MYTSKNGRPNWVYGINAAAQTQQGQAATGAAATAQLPARRARQAPLRFAPTTTSQPKSTPRKRKQQPASAKTVPTKAFPNLQAGGRQQAPISLDSDGEIGEGQDVEMEDDELSESEDDERETGGDSEESSRPPAKRVRMALGFGESDDQIREAGPNETIADNDEAIDGQDQILESLAQPDAQQVLRASSFSPLTDDGANINMNAPGLQLARQERRESVAVARLRDRRVERDDEMSSSSDDESQADDIELMKSVPRTSAATAATRTTAERISNENDAIDLEEDDPSLAEQILGNFYDQPVIQQALALEPRLATDRPRLTAMKRALDPTNTHDFPAFKAEVMQVYNQRGLSPDNAFHSEEPRREPVTWARPVSRPAEGSIARSRRLGPGRFTMGRFGLW